MGTFLMKTTGSVKSQMSDLVEQYRSMEHLSSAYGLNVSLPVGYIDNLELHRQLKFSMQNAQNSSSSFKIEDILSSASKKGDPMVMAVSTGNKLAKSETNSNSSSLSVSSYCSSVASSLPSPYQNTVKFQDANAQPTSNPQAELLLNQANSFFISNPFMNIGNAQG